MSRREKTGYYDRNGKAICDGDRIKAIIGGQIHKGLVGDNRGGYVVDDDWYCYADSYYRFKLADLDDIEILEEE